LRKLMATTARSEFPGEFDEHAEFGFAQCWREFRDDGEGAAEVAFQLPITYIMSNYT
jgi:hypothetical protein